MEVYFNELCLAGEANIQYEDIMRLGKLHACLRSRGILGCRTSQLEYGKLIQQAKIMPGSNPNAINFLFAFLRQPYESEDVEQKQDEYLKHLWLYNGTSCYGLALAYIMESMAISICSLEWKQPLLSIEKDDVTANVRNLFDEETYFFHLEWLDSLQPVDLVKCTIAPIDKKIKLRDDHGKDILQDFCNRLRNNEYVFEIVNSLPFNPGNRKFIHKIYETGLIELVLPWTDKGLGVVVKTTGRNFRETEKIAELLREEYGSI